MHGRRMDRRVGGCMDGWERQIYDLIDGRVGVWTEGDMEMDGCVDGFPLSVSGVSGTFVAVSCSPMYRMFVFCWHGEVWGAMGLADTLSAVRDSRFLHEAEAEEVVVEKWDPKPLFVVSPVVHGIETDAVP